MYVLRLVDNHKNRSKHETYRTETEMERMENITRTIAHYEVNKF